MTHELRPYQREAVQSIFDYFADGNDGNPLVVAPTGSGKSLMIADFSRRVLSAWPSQRILIVAHRKELLQQNAEELWRNWPGAPMGIYSAGLKVRQLGRPITIGGIGSIYRRARELGEIDLMIIDEAHLVPNKGMGMYRTLIEELKRAVPHMKAIGFTATPFRLDTGLLHEGTDRLFTDISYDIDVKMLISQGYLSPLIGKVGTTEADLSNVHIRGGEFVESEMQAAFSQERLVRESVAEILRYARDRRSWLLFSSGVQHAHMISAELSRNGITNEIVVGDTASSERDQTVRSFRDGSLRALVNCGVFTTGFNARNVDMVAILRATQSTGLYVQILGRGMRLSPETGKQNCLILDFGGNIERHGPIDEIRVVSKKRSDGTTESQIRTAPTKVCPNCRTALHIAAKECFDCGHEFDEEKPKHEAKASGAQPISEGRPYEIHVETVNYVRNEKEGKIPSFRVEYYNIGGLDRVCEWWCFEHDGFARSKAVTNWKRAVYPKFKDRPAPETVAEAIQRSHELVSPRSIWVKKDGKFDRIISKTYPFLEELCALQETVKEEDTTSKQVTKWLEDDIPF